jgi:Cd2+/Zn2+-exporting ATPase
MKTSNCQSCSCSHDHHDHDHGGEEFNLKGELLPLIVMISLLIMGIIFEDPLH